MAPSHKRDFLIENLRPIRETYWDILSKFGCREVVLWPVDLVFKSEDEFIYELAPGKTNNLEDLKAGLLELDDVAVFPLLQSIREKSQLDGRDGHRVAFVDKIEDEY